MAFTNTTVKQSYSGDGSTTTFAIPFERIDTSQTSWVKVYVKDTSVDPPTQTLKTISTHYTIVGSNVVFNIAPASTDVVVVARELPLTQVMDLENNADFIPETQELTLDRIVGMIQQLNEKLSRAPLAHISEQVTDDLNYGEPVASTLIGWNDDATQVQLYTFSEVTSGTDADLAAHLADTVDAHDASAISITAITNISATQVQAALAELQANIDLYFGTSALGGGFALITNGSGKITESPVTATELGYVSGVTSSIQSQLTTLSNNINSHLVDANDAHDASAISVVPTGNLGSSDVQSALEELQTDIDNIGTISGPATTDDLPEGSSNLYFTNERVDDRVASLLVAGSNISLSYNDPANTLTISATGTSGISRSISVISSNQTLGSTANTDYVYFVSGTTTVTMPTAVSNTNRYTVKNTGSNTVTIDFTGGETGDGSSTLSLTPNTSLDLISDNSNYRIC